MYVASLLEATYDNFFKFLTDSKFRVNEIMEKNYNPMNLSYSFKGQHPTTLSWKVHLPVIFQYPATPSLPYSSAVTQIS